MGQDRVRVSTGTKKSPEIIGLVALLAEREVVGLVGDAGDHVHREVKGLTVTPFNLPDGCLGGYYPEMNVLIPLWYHDEASKTPASKSVPVRIRR